MEKSRGKKRCEMEFRARAKQILERWGWDLLGASKQEDTLDVGKWLCVPGMWWTEAVSRLTDFIWASCSFVLRGSREHEGPYLLLMC